MIWERNQRGVNALKLKRDGDVGLLLDLPPAFIRVNACDPLRDEAIEFYRPASNIANLARR